jgi:hypothetical protein
LKRREKRGETVLFQHPDEYSAAARFAKDTAEYELTSDPNPIRKLNTTHSFAICMYRRGYMTQEWFVQLRQKERKRRGLRFIVKNVLLRRMYII